MVRAAVYEMRTERMMSADDFWALMEGRLERPIVAGFNSAHHACDRWAQDRARLALIVRHPNNTPLMRQREHLNDIEASGFTDLWSAEASGSDAFTSLAAAAVGHPAFRLGTAIVPAYTRSPALMAMSAAALADVAEGEVVLGIGTSSDVIVEKWNGLSFRAHYRRVRDIATFVHRLPRKSLLLLA